MITMITTKELGLNNNSSADTSSKSNNLSAVDIIYENMIDLKTKFAIGDVLIQNHRLPNMS